MKRIEEYTVRRLHLSPEKREEIRKNKLHAVITPCNEESIEEAKSRYYEKGAPLGSAWQKGGRVDYIALTEALFHDEESGAITYEDGHECKHVEKWVWSTKRPLSPAHMPAEAARTWVAIDDVEVFEIGDIRPGIVTKLGYRNWLLLSEDLPNDINLVWVYHLGEKIYR